MNSSLKSFLQDIGLSEDTKFTKAAQNYLTEMMLPVNESMNTSAIVSSVSGMKSGGSRTVLPSEYFGKSTTVYRGSLSGGNSIDVGGALRRLNSKYVTKAALQRYLGK